MSTIADPLADSTACARDAALMQKLGLNVVRVYEVDPSKNHDACMKSFADAGLYVLLDIATPKFSVNRKSPEYDTRLYDAYRKTVDAFKNYDNMFAFIAGNEVTNDKTNTQASAYVKAAIRDVKKFLKANTQRYIPVGYASNDDEYIRDAIKDYFVCGEDEDEQADFFGVNMYEWCGDSTFEKSGYSDRTKEFSTFSKPVFLSEYGCNLVNPRPFSEVASIYGADMTSVWSGGVVYEFTQENNNYGLVKLANGQAELLSDYDNLQKALAKVNPQGVNMDAYTDVRQAPSCPQMSENWKASTKLPPTPSDGACRCMQENLGCVASDKVMNSDTTGGSSSSSALGNQIDMLCGMVSCDDISGSGENGTYGAFSFCSPTEKLSWLYHLYMEKNKDGKCDFDGYASTVSPQRNDLGTCADIQASMDGSSSGDSSGQKGKSQASMTSLPSAVGLGVALLASALLFPQN